MVHQASLVFAMNCRFIAGCLQSGSREAIRTHGRARSVQCTKDRSAWYYRKQFFRYMPPPCNSSAVLIHERRWSSKTPSLLSKSKWVAQVKEVLTTVLEIFVLKSDLTGL